MESAYDMYFINDRLALPGAIVEDGRESASYDCNTGLYSTPYDISACFILLPCSTLHAGMYMLQLQSLTWGSDPCGAFL